MTLHGGDGNVMRIYPAIIGQYYIYKYDTLKSFDVVATLTNPRGQNVTLSYLNELLWPIVDMDITVSLLFQLCSCGFNHLNDSPSMFLTLGELAFLCWLRDMSKPRQGILTSLWELWHSVIKRGPQLLLG